MQTSRSIRAFGLATAVVCGLLGRYENTASADPPPALQNETARGLALGSGMRASSISTSALSYNAAGLPFGRLYHVEGLVDYSPNTDTLMLGAGVVDSLTSSFAMGFSARGLLAQSDSAPGGFDFRLGGGLPLSEAISLGVSGRYLNFKSPEALTGADNVDPDAPAEDDPRVKGFTLDAALAVRVSDAVHIAALGYNLIRRDSAYVPTMVGGSLSITAAPSFTLGSDVLVDLTTFNRATFFVGGGAEYLHESTIPIRVGYLFDSGRAQHFVSGGVGYNDTKMGAELGLQQGVAGTNDTRVMAALRYYVN